MSGHPKKSTAQIREEQQRRLEQERRRKAEQEARLRAEAAARKKAQQLAQDRADARALLKDAERQLATEQGRIDASELQEAKKQLASVANKIASAKEPGFSHEIASELRSLISGVYRSAARHQQQSDSRELASATQRRIAALRQQTTCKVLLARLHAIETKIAIGSNRTAIPEAADQLNSLDGEIQLFHQRQDAEKAEAERKLQRAAEIVESLSADATIVKWCNSELTELRQSLAKANEAFISNSCADAASIAETVCKREAELIQGANASQLKADHRDYIAASIAQALQDLGFAVAPAHPEHQDNPATAMIIEASTVTGRSIGVSVPVDDEIWYEVNGFPMREESGKSVRTAYTCDEAEHVLSAMHASLESAFGISMSELMWEGKDPDRMLRRADELPSSTAASRGGVR